jgi:Rps23 Pro-64 3,4-dihydroxylase Tpa1-like proline 4-hydroxylase
VFFPSGTFHEVTRVASPSGRLEDARFTFAGHVHTADGATTALDTPSA